LQLKSGSFLISTAPFYGSKSIPPPVLDKCLVLAEPDWSLLHLGVDNDVPTSTTQLQDQVNKLTLALQLSHCSFKVSNTHRLYSAQVTLKKPRFAAKLLGL
jgi:hypothetical protein